jgi:hypothetical protein
MLSVVSRTHAGNVGKSATTTYTAPDEHDTFEPPTAAALQGRTVAGGCEDKSCQHCDEVSATVHVPVLGLCCAYTSMCYRNAYFTGPHVSASLVIHANTAWRLLSCGSGCVAVWLSVLFPLPPTAAARASEWVPQRCVANCNCCGLFSRCLYLVGRWHTPR